MFFISSAFTFGTGLFLLMTTEYPCSIGFELKTPSPSLNKKTTINNTVKLVIVLLSINNPSINLSENFL